MTDQFSIPPLRDLPPGRLALRAEHLQEEITRRGRPALAMPHFAIPHPHVARPVIVALMALIAVLALVPIGGASLGSRAISGISGLWTSDNLPPAPTPYQPGDKVWTTTPTGADGSREFNPPAGYTAPQPPAAPPAYRNDDRVWTTTPPTVPQTTTTITCSAPSDAAKLLTQLEKEGSPITSVECR